MTSFDRIFKLAKKTGDRLIVFDSVSGEGFATIPIDEYEKMVSDPRDVASLSGDQLIKQINNDIGLWREKKENYDDAFDMPTSSDEDFGFSNNWKSAGDILQDRFQFDGDDHQDNEGDNYEDGDGDFLFDSRTRMDDWHDGGEIESKEEDKGILDIHFDFQKDEESRFDDSTPDYFNERHVQHIPLRDFSEVDTWKEEPLEDEPVFFEEPI